MITLLPFLVCAFECSLQIGGTGGAQLIAQHLAEKGVELELIIDEVSSLGSTELCQEHDLDMIWEYMKPCGGRLGVNILIGGLLLL